MSTADRIDSTIAGGLAGIKQHMKQTQNSIKATNEKADRIEKEKEQAHHIYLKAYGRQQAMRDKRTDIEEKLNKNEEKLKYLTRKAEEKESFLAESKKFSNKLKTVAPEESEVLESEQRLQSYKDIYSKNYERYQKARTLKIELEQKVEQAELRAREAKRRLEALQTELEYNLIEEGRRTEGCKDAIDSAFKSEKSCLDLQRGLDIIMKNKEGATKKINTYESKINKVEDSIESTNYDRRRVEATIRELLLSIKRESNNNQ